MQAGRARTVVASAAALVVLAGLGVGCSNNKSGGDNSGPATVTASTEACQQIVDDAVAAWQAYTAKHGSDLQQVPEDAKDDYQTLTTAVTDLQSRMTDEKCNPDEIGNAIKAKAPDFLGLNSSGPNS